MYTKKHLKSAIALELDDYKLLHSKDVNSIDMYVLKNQLSGSQGFVKIILMIQLITSGMLCRLEQNSLFKLLEYCSEILDMHEAINEYQESTTYLYLHHILEDLEPIVDLYYLRPTAISVDSDNEIDCYDDVDF